MQRGGYGSVIRVRTYLFAQPPENKSPYDLRVGVFSFIFSPCFGFTEKRTKAKMAFKSLPPPPLFYGRIRSVCKLFLHYLLSLVPREVNLCPDQPRCGYAPAR